jgi:hypothetical protein
MYPDISDDSDQDICQHAFGAGCASGHDARVQAKFSTSLAIASACSPNCLLLEVRRGRVVGLLADVEVDLACVDSTG